VVFASSRKNRVFFWIFGFILTFNWLVIPISSNSPRFTDLFSVGVLLILLFKLSNSGFTKLGLIILPLAIASLGLIVNGVLINDMSLAIFTARMFFAATTGIWLAQIIVETESTEIFFFGAAFGALCVAGIAYAQSTETMPVFDLFIPPGTKTWWGNGQLRAVGIWQHPNALGQVQSIGAACAVSLALAGPKIRILPGLLFLGIIGLTYIGNETRSMIMAAGLATLVSMLVSPNKTLKVVGALVGLYAVLLAPFFLKAVLGDRWFGTGNDPSVGANAAERFKTLLYSIQLVLEQPTGHGVIGSRAALFKVFGFSATHNSLISLALTVGVIPLMVLLMAIIVRIRSILTINRIRYEAAPLFAILMLFFFEDSIFLPSTLLAVTIFSFWGAKIIVPIPTVIPQIPSGAQVTGQ